MSKTTIQNNKGAVQLKIRPFVKLARIVAGSDINDKAYLAASKDLIICRNNLKKRNIYD